VPNEIVVRFRAGVTPSRREAALARANANAQERILTNAMRGAGDTEGLTVARTPMAVPGAIEALRSDPDVVYAEPNWIYTHQAASTDPYFTNTSLWGMYGDGSTPANQYGSQAAEAWAAGHTGSASVFVGIIDEGIQFDHPDLSGRSGRIRSISRTAWTTTATGTSTTSAAGTSTAATTRSTTVVRAEASTTTVRTSRARSARRRTTASVWLA
jgi:hypothetical protein